MMKMIRKRMSALLGLMVSVTVLFAWSGDANAAPASITSVGVPADGTYSAGDRLDFTLNFTEAVTVTGTPYIILALNTGGVVQARYSSGSGTSAPVFSYTIKATDQDLDGIVVRTPMPPAGTIQANGVNVDRTLNSIGSTVNVRIDNTPAPAAVPTLTEWAMIFLAGLLGLFGAARLGLVPTPRRD